MADLCYICCSFGQAWDDTFRNWEVITQYLENYPKDAKVKADSEIPTGLGDTIRKRKPPHHANTEHELEVGLVRFLNLLFCSTLCRSAVKDSIV